MLAYKPYRLTPSAKRSDGWVAVADRCGRLKAEQKHAVAK
jgi:hypothetical protein